MVQGIRRMKMKQIKIFRKGIFLNKNNEVELFAKDVNQFCSKKNVLDITFRTETMMDVIFFICCVVYED